MTAGGAQVRVTVAREDYLAGLTPAGVISLVAWRCLGPRDPRRPRAVLLWATSTLTVDQIAARSGVGREAVNAWIRATTAAAAAARLPAALSARLAASTAPVRTIEVARRQARLLGLPAPMTAASPPRPTPAERGAIVTAERVLAALGPLPGDVLVSAVLRRHRPRRSRLTEPEVLGALQAAAGLRVDDAGRWDLATPRAPMPRDQRLLDLAPPGAVLTRQQMLEALQGAGYSERASLPELVRNPLLEHVDHGRWRVLNPACGHESDRADR